MSLHTYAPFSVSMCVCEQCSRATTFLYFPAVSSELTIQCEHFVNRTVFRVNNFTEHAQKTVRFSTCGSESLSYYIDDQHALLQSALVFWAGVQERHCL